MKRLLTTVVFLVFALAGAMCMTAMGDKYYELAHAGSVFGSACSLLLLLFAPASFCTFAAIGWAIKEYADREEQ